jgi:transmembrane sensor
MDQNTNSTPEIEDLIIRFLRRETSAYEIRKLEEWLKQDPSNRVQFDEINTAYQALHADTGRKSAGTAWKKLSEKIEESSVHATNHKTVSLYPLSPARFSFLKIAASVALLAVVSAGVWLYSTRHTDNAVAEVTERANHEKKLIVLPDGTKVWLNEGSSITYGGDFNKSNRNILLRGEAFFDVTKTGIDFVVATNSMSIEVKGTRFNVNAISDDNECTTLEEGRVELKVKGHDGTIEMKPGDQVTFDDGSKRVTRKVVNAASYSTWKEKELRFNNAPLHEILEQMERRFQIDIEINRNIANEKLSITIGDEKLEEVLELIAISSSLKYTVQGNSVSIYE